MKTIIWIAAALGVAGCATCRQHPTACGIASAVLVGSAVATLEANSGRAPAMRQITPPQCVVNPAICR